MATLPCHFWSQIPSGLLALAKAERKSLPTDWLDFLYPWFLDCLQFNDGGNLNISQYLPVVRTDILDYGHRLSGCSVRRRVDAPIIDNWLSVFGLFFLACAGTHCLLFMILMTVDFLYMKLARQVIYDTSFSSLCLISLLCLR
jgi:hypothetical protein